MAQRIIMVTGKGGVGKSTVAAVIAQAEAQQGKKALLVELGERSQYCYLYGREIGYDPIQVGEALWVALWSGEACLKEYLYHLVRIQKVVDLFFDNRIMKAFVKAAPALRELAVTGKITSGIRKWGPELDYDVVVVDAYATGHFLALVQAPRGMGELVEKGPMGEQSRRIHEVLTDSQSVNYKVVALPEELPVVEALELSKQLKEKLGQESQIILNKWFFSRGQSTDYRSFEGDFAQYLADLVDRQEHSESMLGTHVKLPLCFSSNYKDVVSELLLSWSKIK